MPLLNSDKTSNSHNYICILWPICIVGTFRLIILKYHRFLMMNVEVSAMMDCSYLVLISYCRLRV